MASRPVDEASPITPESDTTGVNAASPQVGDSAPARAYSAPVQPGNLQVSQTATFSQISQRPGAAREPLSPRFPNSPSSSSLLWAPVDHLGRRNAIFPNSPYDLNANSGYGRNNPPIFNMPGLGGSSQYHEPVSVSSSTASRMGDEVIIAELVTVLVIQRVANEILSRLSADLRLSSNGTPAEAGSNAFQTDTSASSSSQIDNPPNQDDSEH